MVCQIHKLAWLFVLEILKSTTATVNLLNIQMKEKQSALKAAVSGSLDR